MPSSSSAPSPAVYPAWCIDRGTWYIAGGYDANSSSTSLFSLDLTIPWDSAGPPWVQLPNGPHLSTSTCIVWNNDKYPFLHYKDPILVYFGNEDNKQPLVSLLDLSNHTWVFNATKRDVPFRNSGLVPVTNPLDGKIYIRGGYHSATANTMDIYNPQTDSYSTIPIPQSPTAGRDISTGATGVPSAQWYGAVWLTKRSSIIYFGGRVPSWDSYAPGALYEYIPASNTWGVLNTTGQGPAAREDPCVATDQNNSKLIVYGGQSSQDFLGDIYILDLNSLEWTKGPSTDSRIGMACTMFDDGFLVWGGASDPFLTQLYTSRPSVFNVSTLQWTNSYKTENTSTLTLPTKDSGGKINALALSLVLTMSALGLGALGVGIFLYRREKKKARRNYDRIQKAKGKAIEDPSNSLHSLSSPESSPLNANNYEMEIPRAVLLRHNEGASTGPYIFGKYDDDDIEEYYRSGQRNKNASDIGHKIEMAPSEITIDKSVIENSRHESPIFIPQSSVGLRTAPPVHINNVFQSQSIAERHEKEKHHDAILVTKD
ncbi:acyl-CoA-binding domain-containing protein 4, partial [Entomortierella lignicola]